MRTTLYTLWLLEAASLQASQAMIMRSWDTHFSAGLLDDSSSRAQNDGVFWRTHKMNHDVCEDVPYAEIRSYTLKVRHAKFVITHFILIIVSITFAPYPSR